VAQTELALRRGERPDLLAVVDRALHALIKDLDRAEMVLPTILGVVIDSEAVEILLERPATPPSGWSVTADGFRWRSETTTTPPEDAHTSAPLPALVPLGKAASGRADVLINLEAAAVLGVAGDPIRAAGVVRALAANLAGTPWAAAANLIVAGFGEQLAAAEHVRAVSSVSEVTAELRSVADVMARVPRFPNSGLAPTIVLCAQRPDPNDLAILGEVARPGTTVAAVIPIDGPPARWVIDVDSTPMPIDPIRLAIEPTVLSASQLHDIGQLLE
jgi:hypothetical protein